MEARILHRLCSGSPIRRIGCNGDNVNLRRMCDFIETQIRSLGNRHYPIFLVFDREQRNESADFICVDIKEELDRRGFSDQDIRIFVADREFEDWYLKDVEGICRHFDIPVPALNLRGKGGLERLLANSAGYHETTTGVDLFFVVSLAKIAAECAIFRRMIESSRELGCEYVQGRLEFV